MKTIIKTLCAVLLIGSAAAASAVAIFPNTITVSGVPGSKAPVQIKVYGHPVATTVEFVKSKDLKSLDEIKLATFELGAEQQRVVPLDIVIPEESTEYYLCAVLSRSQSMRLRVCLAVRVIANPP